MRIFTGLAVALLLTSATSANAETPPYIEFVRGLRKDGLNDLALEYLEKLRTTAPKEVQALLPVEYAKTLLEAASTELDDGKRTGMLATAKAEFERYLKANPGDPDSMLELARLQSLQARARLAKARRNEDEAARIKEGELVRPMFDDAAKRYAAAGKLVTEEIKKIRTDESQRARLRTLQDAQARSHLEQAINEFYVSETYLDKNKTDQQLKRANSIKRSRIDFARLFEANEPPDRYGWIAAAWYGHLSVQMDGFTCRCQQDLR
jgi:tetratricopeptide (TPR) repeat protein